MLTLDELLGRLSGSPDAVKFSILEVVADDLDLVAWIKAERSCIERGDPSRARAYVHPNGFTKLRLASSSDGSYVARLHVWVRPVADSEIHSHRWDYWSKVVRGQIIERRYDVAVESGCWSIRECRQTGGNGYSFGPAKACGLTETDANLHSAGDCYVRDHRSLHRVDVSERLPTVTLMIQGPSMTDTSVVVSPADKSEVNYRPVQYLDQGRLKQLLCQVEELLG